MSDQGKTKEKHVHSDATSERYGNCNSFSDWPGELFQQFEGFFGPDFDGFGRMLNETQAWTLQGDPQPGEEIVVPQVSAALAEQLSGGLLKISTDNKFKMTTEAKDYSPEEITVKVVDNVIEIHGKQKERREGQASVSCNFYRRYTLPPGVNRKRLTYQMSPDGTITVEAPYLKGQGSIQIRKTNLTENNSGPVNSAGKS